MIINIKTSGSNVLLIDTETVGDIKRCISFDISIIIYNIKTKTVLYCVNYLISDIYNNNITSNLINKDKYNSIKDYKLISIRILHKRLLNLIKRYNINVLGGYCVSFDIQALTRLFSIKRLDTTVLNSLKLLDIKQVGIYIKNTKHYKKFSIENNLLTDKNNISFKLKDISSYILQDTIKISHIAKYDNKNNVLLLQYATTTLKYRLILK